MQPRWHFHLFYYTQNMSRKFYWGGWPRPRPNPPLCNRKGRALEVTILSKRQQQLHSKKNHKKASCLSSTLHYFDKRPLLQAQPNADLFETSYLRQVNQSLISKSTHPSQLCGSHLTLFYFWNIKSCISSRELGLLLKCVAGFPSQQRGHRVVSPTGMQQAEPGIKGNGYQPPLHNQSQIPNPSWHTREAPHWRACRYDLSTFS